MMRIVAGLTATHAPGSSRSRSNMKMSKKSKKLWYCLGRSTSYTDGTIEKTWQNEIRSLNLEPSRRFFKACVSHVSEMIIRTIDDAPRRCASRTR